MAKTSPSRHSTRRVVGETCTGFPVLGPRLEGGMSVLSFIDCFLFGYSLAEITARDLIGELQGFLRFTRVFVGVTKFVAIRQAHDDIDG